mmetsp:Transcript_21277/g.31508  ORF Transcript_21277/g.31508 Transcript_21277/m.31508 type:complete len:349 (+) Transcript_21277:86-1132(+)
MNSSVARSSGRKMSGKKLAHLAIALTTFLLMYYSNFSAKPEQLGTKRRSLETLSNDSIYDSARSLFVDPQKTSMLIGIFSTTGSKYSHRRDYIRDTFLGQDEPRLCTIQEFIRQTEESPQKRVCQVAYTFVIGAGGHDRPTDHDDNEPLTVDNDQFGNSEDDCTYLNVMENMEDGKSPTYLKFGANIANQYGIDYITKMDDDTVLTHKNFFDWIDSDLPPTPYNTRTYGGATRPSRIKTTLYGAGEFYFMSTDLADYVGNKLTTEDRLLMMHPRRHVEDLDMGTFVFSNPRPIKFVSMDQKKIWSHPKKTEDEYRTEWDATTKSGWIPRKQVFQWNFYCKHILNGGCF